MTATIRDAFDNKTNLPGKLHDRAMRLWREYLLVGGMPQAVVEYLKSKDMERVDRIKRRILRLYRDDIVKFAGGDKGRVSAIFDEIPGQLSKHEKKFTLAALDKNARSREYSGAFFWLGDARITNNCFSSNDPIVGLAMNQENSALKCYMSDTGLLVSHAFADRGTTPDQVYKDILFDKLEINEGMLVENAIAQQLHAVGHRLFYFSKDANNAADRMEIDFLIAGEYENAAMKLRVSSIEVKSGKGRYATSSLDKFKKKYSTHIGTQYILHRKPLRVEEDRIFLPLYMSFFL